MKREEFVEHLRIQPSEKAPDIPGGVTGSEQALFGSSPHRDSRSTNP